MSARRPAVSLLLGVWGPGYVEAFLELSLRSLLAPGNLPALARAFECTFVFLTTREDEAIIRADAAFAKLSRHCAVRFVDISDLVFPESSSTTLTLGFERAMRATGAGLLDTYFIYLVSDYVMADGSLANLIAHLERGVSGITSGNFHVVDEEARAELLARRSPDGDGDGDGALAMPPRELVRFALARLHPLTVASTVTQTAAHDGHANRLFWRCGEDALVGRFWLRHMLCIKPETADFRIGSSCDYSFIPEMCPSGNVVHLTDSDEYCVVELTAGARQGLTIAPGKIDPRALARDLSEWTTAEHRRNVDTATVFHARDVDGEVERAVAASQTYVDAIKPLLSPRPKPVRGHPYWAGAVAEPGVPRVGRWHHEWQDYGPLMEHLEATVRRGRRVLAVHAAPNPCSLWLTKNHAQQTTFLHRDRLHGEAPASGGVDVCYFFLDARHGADLPKSVARALPRVAARGEIVIHIGGDAPEMRMPSGVTLTRVHHARSRFAVPAGRWRDRLARAVHHRRALVALTSLAALAPLLCAVRLDNGLAARPGRGRTTSTTLFLERRT